MENNPEITIDLLLRAGFKKLSEDVYIIKGLKYTKNQLPKGATGHGSFFIYKGEPIYRIYYWNDLQKLYFEKTGSHLKLN